MLPQALRIEARIDLKTLPGTGKLTGLDRVVRCQTRLVPIDAHCRDDAQAKQLMRLGNLKVYPPVIKHGCETAEKWAFEWETLLGREDFPASHG